MIFGGAESYLGPPLINLGGGRGPPGPPASYAPVRRHAEIIYSPYELFIEHLPSKWYILPWQNFLSLAHILLQDDAHLSLHYTRHPEQ